MRHVIFDDSMVHAITCRGYCLGCGIVAALALTEWSWDLDRSPESDRAGRGSGYCYGCGDQVTRQNAASR
jgi:hypothetical protein